MAGRGGSTGRRGPWASWQVNGGRSGARAENREPLARIRPVLNVAKAGAGQQVTEGAGSVFVRILGMYTLAAGEAPLCAGPADAHVGQRLQVHLDAGMRFVVARHVAPVVDVEIAVQQGVHVAQQVEVEGG